ncbi:Sip1-related alpha-galactosidase [Paenibacillus sp. GYB004]|uniref:Sip1-related alpha-galactosidase n=1 Tax=Paenibacillus sp. GYB004 TaxID=2994393 RepID=UPI002F96977A
MFLFDQQTSSLQFEGVPDIALRGLSVQAMVAGEPAVALTLTDVQLCRTNENEDGVEEARVSADTVGDGDEARTIADATGCVEEARVSADTAGDCAETRTSADATDRGNGTGEGAARPDSGEYRLTFGSVDGAIAARLVLRQRGAFLAVHVEASIRNQTAYHAQRTFATEGGIRLTFRELSGLQGLLAAARHKEWWTRPHFDPDLRRLPPRMQSLLWKTGAGYGYMLPLCDELYRTDLAGSEGGLTVLVSSGEAGHETIRTAALVLGADTDPFRLASAAADEGFAARHKGGSPRTRKAYPDILEYVGWCSWDAFYADVDEKGLMEKAAELRRLGLPVRWFMIDDGWSEVKERKLAAFGADKRKFPGGLARTVSRLKRDHGIRWVGAWHNIAGYWGGIDPEGEAHAEARPYVHRTRSGRWIPHPDAALNFGFWNMWHSKLKRQGIDFVKVDNQSSLYAYMGGERSIAATAHAVHTGLEASAALHFGGCVINCMGMASENVWHRPLSSVSRSSNDFLPKIADGFGEHALQNAYNSVYHGPFYWGDWDMFWTGHHDAVPHMTLRAVSGGPVYFSDGPGQTVPDIIRPLIYGDGKIIRCDRIGQPTEEWLTVDPLITPQAFKVWNMAGGAGIVAAFHVYNGRCAVEGRVGPGDIPLLEGSSYIAFDSFRKKAYRLQAGESIPVRLSPLEAELYVIVPVTGEFTAIGLTDKLVASDAVLSAEYDEETATVRLKDGGTFAFVSERKPAAAFVNEKPAVIEEDEDMSVLYTIVCPAADGEPGREVTVRIEYGPDAAAAIER